MTNQTCCNIQVPVRHNSPVPLDPRLESSRPGSAPVLEASSMLCTLTIGCASSARASPIRRRGRKWLRRISSLRSGKEPGRTRRRCPRPAGPVVRIARDALRTDETSGPGGLVRPVACLARGLLGMVAFQGKWGRPETVGRKVDNDPAYRDAIREYLDRRARTADKADAQLKLAAWCDQKGLKAQARSITSR